MKAVIAFVGFVVVVLVLILALPTTIVWLCWNDVLAPRTDIAPISWLSAMVLWGTLSALTGLLPAKVCRKRLRVEE